jgi:hypothetical protein
MAPSAFADQPTRRKRAKFFHKISSGRNAFGGFGHPDGDLHGPTRHIAG